MKPVFDIVIPTFNRVRKLKRLLASLKKQTYQNFSVTVVADNNCGETKKAWGLGELGDAYIICNDTQEMPIKIWNRYLRNHPECNLVYICDDTELDEDCLSNAVGHFTSSDMLIGFRQRIKEITGMCEGAMGIVGKKFADRFKNRQVFCPHYFNMNVDGELVDCAKKLGVFKFAEDAVLTHYHQGFYKEEEDSTHSLVRKKQEEDGRLRRSRIKNNLIWGVNEGTA